MKQPTVEPGISLLLFLIWNFMSFATGELMEEEMVTFHITNKCPFHIWPANNPTAGEAVITDGGFLLRTDQTKRVQVPSTWSGRFWARTGCNFTCASSHTNKRLNCNSKPPCRTGDCQNQLSCNGAVGVPPATLIVVSLRSDGIVPSFYSVTLVDGYNLPVSISTKPVNPSCTIKGCTKSVNSLCPMELQVLDRSGAVEACKSPCLAYQTDAYCCIRTHGTPESCKPNKYSKLFKEACPSYFSYAFDAPPPIMNCTAKDYAITFCPSKWKLLQPM